MMKGGRWLAVMAVVAGCAGQLELAPEAYTSSAQPSSGAASDAGTVTPSSVGIGSGAPTPWPAGSDAAPGPVADPGYGPTTTPVTGDAAWPTPAVDAAAAAPPAADAGAPAPVASVCPPGVEALGLIAKRCGGCHGDRMPSKGLDLVTPGVAARLVGVKSACEGKPLLAPLAAGATGGEPTGHFLDKLIGPVAGCGAQMPYGAAALTPGEFDCLVEWSARAVARGTK
jgi:hypothetical protein